MLISNSEEPVVSVHYSPNSFWKQGDEHCKWSLWPSDLGGQPSRKDANTNLVLRFQLTWLARSFLQSVPRTTLYLLLACGYLFFLLAKVSLLLNRHSSCLPVLASHPFVFLESYIPHLEGQIHFDMSPSPHTVKQFRYSPSFETSR